MSVSTSIFAYPGFAMRTLFIAFLLLLLATFADEVR